MKKMNRLGIAFVVAVSMFVGVILVAKPPSIKAQPPCQCFYNKIQPLDAFFTPLSGWVRFDWDLTCSPKTQRGCNNCAGSLEILVFDANDNLVGTHCTDTNTLCGSVQWVDASFNVIEAGLPHGNYSAVCNVYGVPCTMDGGGSVLGSLWTYFTY